MNKNKIKNKKGVSDQAIRAALKKHDGSKKLASEELHVDPSTLHRWITKDPRIAKLHSLKQRIADAEETEENAASPEDFRDWVLSSFAPNPAQRQLLELCVASLKIARDGTLDEKSRLSAMKEYRSLLKDLNLELKLEDDE